jgi:hypothetical protein
LALTPLAIPYLQRRAAGELPLPEVNVDPDLVRWVRGVFGEPLRRIVPEWVGWGVVVLGIGALLRQRAFRAAGDRRGVVRVGTLAAVAVVALLIARGSAPIFGDHVVPFDWVSVVVPGFEHVRQPRRFGILASFALSAMAAFSVAGARRLAGWQESARWGLVVGLLGAGIAVMPMAWVQRLGVWTVPLGSDVPVVYRWLAANGGGQPLLELPMGYEALAMYHSTYHWLPLLNGYTGYAPSSYGFLRNYAEQLPSAGALRVLVDCAGLHWILVRAGTPLRAQGWDRLAGVRLKGAFGPGGQDRPYEVTETADSGCGARLFQYVTTIEGLRWRRSGRWPADWRSICRTGSRRGRSEP